MMPIDLIQNDACRNARRDAPTMPVAMSLGPVRGTNEGRYRNHRNRGDRCQIRRSHLHLIDPPVSCSSPNISNSDPRYLPLV